MSEDDRNAKDIAAGNDKISDTETFGESLPNEETVCCAEEGLLLPDDSVGRSDADEESLAGAVDGGSTDEELLEGAVGGCDEASTATESVPKHTVVTVIENLQKALLRNAQYQLGQFQTIKDELVETIKELKELSRRNPGNWEIFERLRDHIKEANSFLEEINEAMMVHESREQYMNLQINQFFEKRVEQGEHVRDTTFNSGTTEDANLEIQTASISSNAQKRGGPSAEEGIDRSHFDFVDQMIQATRFTSRMGEMNETKEVQVDMEEAGGAAEEPDRMEIERENELEDRDDEGRLLHPPVTGKYTLAITAHQLYPESSSEDSPEDCPPQGAEGGSPRRIQQRNIGVGEDVPVEDPSHGNYSSDSSNDEQRDPYGL